MPSIINASTTLGLISTADTSGVLQLQTANTTAVTVSATQNVGIGVTPSASSVKTFEIGAVGLGLTNRASGKIALLQNAYFNSGFKYAASGMTTAMYEVDNGTHYWYNAPSGTAGNAISFTNSMLLDTSGNLGLGLTPSGSWGTQAFILGKSGASNPTYPFIASTDSQAVLIGSNSYWDGTNFKAQFGGAGVVAMHQKFNYNAITWHTAPAVTTGTTQTFTQAMTLDASGNLGIGTTSPSNRVSIVTASGSDGIVSVKSPTTETAGVLIDGGSTSNKGALLTLAKDATTKWRIGLDSAIGGGTNNNLNILGSSTDALLFGTNGTERARITSGGYFKASNNGSYIGSGSSYHELVSNVGDWILYSRNTNASPGGVMINHTTDANGTSNHFLYCSATASETLRMSVRSNGGIANYSANNVNLSDRREKTNFAPATSYLDKICAIPVQTFNYIDQNLEEDGGLTLGVVAQDVQAVAPELVMESNWASKDEEPKMRLSIYQTDLQYALMKCIQEQQAIIESLKARLDAANL